jgi:hypothetical protein
VKFISLWRLISHAAAAGAAKSADEYSDAV